VTNKKAIRNVKIGDFHRNRPEPNGGNVEVKTFIDSATKTLALEFVIFVLVTVRRSIRSVLPSYRVPDVITTGTSGLLLNRIDEEVVHQSIFVETFSIKLHLARFPLMKLSVTVFCVTRLHLVGCCQEFLGCIELEKFCTERCRYSFARA
jgi:hypothetical protein